MTTPPGQFPPQPQQLWQGPPPQQMSPQHYQQQPPPPRKKHTGLKIAGGIIGGLFVIGILANMGGGSTQTATPAAAPLATAAAGTEPAAPTTQAPDKATEPAVPAEHRAALRKAQSYSDNMHMSKRGVYDQLTAEYGEKFPAEAAQYAVDNVKADWNKNALEKARSYQKNMSMSKEGIRDQLTSEYGEKFTQSEADYAVANL